MKQILIDAVEKWSGKPSHNGFPCCPICGAPLGWESDYNADELGYQPEDESTEVINLLCCNHCELDFETHSADGEYHLLSVASFKDEDIDFDECKHNFTDYAKKRFPYPFTLD